MWPFVDASRRNHRQQNLIAARPHPSRILRSRSRRTAPIIEHDKMVIVVRGDIPLTAGRVAQHAASVAVRLFQRVCRSAGVCTRWNRTGQRKLVLRVNDAKALDDVTRRAIEKKIAVSAAHIKVAESDNKVRTLRTLVGLFGPSKAIDPLIKGLKPY